MANQHCTEVPRQNRGRTAILEPPLLGNNHSGHCLGQQSSDLPLLITQALRKQVLSLSVASSRWIPPESQLTHPVCLNVSACGARGVAKAELSDEADSENYRREAPKTGYVLYFIGLDVHKKTIGYCVKDSAGRVHQKGKIRSTRRELDCWIRTLPQPGRSPWKRRSLPAGYMIPASACRKRLRCHIR